MHKDFFGKSGCFCKFFEFGVNICKILEIKDTFRILQIFSLPLFIIKQVGSCSQKYKQTRNGVNLCKILILALNFRILQRYTLFFYTHAISCHSQ